MKSQTADRRPGDIAVCYVDAGKAKRELGWQAKRGLVDMCRDAWRFEKYCDRKFLAVTLAVTYCHRWCAKRSENLRVFSTSLNSN